MRKRKKTLQTTWIFISKKASGIDHSRPFRQAFTGTGKRRRALFVSISVLSGQNDFLKEIDADSFATPGL
jgi:hypothetical protein